MQRQTISPETSTIPDLNHLFAGCLEDLGGSKFILNWAKSNPSDFMRLLVSLPTRHAAPSGSPEQPKHAAQAITHEVLPSPVEASGSGVGAFDRRSAAEYLSISVRLLDDLLSAGQIRRVKLGRKTLVRKIDLDRYLQKLVEETVPTEHRV